MKFFIQNNMGDKGFYETESIVDAVHTAWNIEGCLYLNDKLIFAPFENNETLSEMLEEFNLRVID